MNKLIPLEKLFTKKPHDDWHKLSTLPHVIHNMNGLPISLKSSIGRVKQSTAPVAVSRKHTVVGDLIPSTSWGASLAHLLTRDSWNKLRRPLIAAHNHVCEICGTRQNSLDVHEVWDYEFPSEAQIAKVKKGRIFGIQKLTGLLTVCNECHRCFHLGREYAVGTLDETLHRLQILNNWTEYEVQRYYDMVVARWETTSRVNWQLDFSKVSHPDGHLTIERPWILHPQDANQTILTKESPYGEPNLTVLLNTAWKFEGSNDIRHTITEKKFIRFDI